ncbi:hypothetical protein FKG94_20870 [Exilibacterium tricleocarpae]|uniref:Uncharacterized protein n=1 Tax=Exilibacterium tricleocarpae TaxID=2591008 RepID=A0A545T0N7_9GAMM|nr:hypothetical protein [Exilibacterium tricleocarpae]TQV70782.1 hypothetical protein FKG94_20870 [Exilibacterium tricleocarpae]
MSITLRSIGLFGILLFGILLSITFISPKTIEESAKGFVKYQIEKEVREKQQAIRDSSVAGKALSISEKLGLESEQIRENLNNNLPQKIARVIASMCGYDCERTKALAQSITTGYLDRLKSIKVAQDTLGDLIKGKYIEIVGNLKFELRIFLGLNFAMFLILLIVSFAKPKAIAHLFLPGVLLVLATILSSAVYLYGQDWFYTILYNDYMGFGYLAYLVIIFGVLIDIALNKARVTTEVINGIANAFGSAFSVLPC